MVRLNERQVLIAMWRDEFTATHCGYQNVLDDDTYTWVCVWLMAYVLR